MNECKGLHSSNFRLNLSHFVINTTLRIPQKVLTLRRSYSSGHVGVIPRGVIPRGYSWPLLIGARHPSAASLFLGREVLQSAGLLEVLGVTAV